MSLSRPGPNGTALGAAGFFSAPEQQFHFINKGYADFEGFLNDLASRKRKMIRRERKEALGERHRDRGADRRRHHANRIGTRFS